MPLQQRTKDVSACLCCDAGQNADTTGSSGCSCCNRTVVRENSVYLNRSAERKFSNYTLRSLDGTTRMVHFCRTGSLHEVSMLLTATAGTAW